MRGSGNTGLHHAIISLPSITHFGAVVSDAVLEYGYCHFLSGKWKSMVPDLSTSDMTINVTQLTVKSFTEVRKMVKMAFRAEATNG